MQGFARLFWEGFFCMMELSKKHYLFCLCVFTCIVICLELFQMSLGQLAESIVCYRGWSKDGQPRLFKSTLTFELLWPYGFGFRRCFPHSHHHFSERINDNIV